MLQVYDWALQFGDEYRLVLKARWTSAKVGYLLCRYYPLLAWIVILWAWTGNHKKSLCESVLKPVHCLLIPMQLCSQGVMLMRAYAFTGRNKIVLVLLGLCYFAAIGLNIWGLGAKMSLPHGLFLALGRTGCFPDHSGGVLAARMAAVISVAVLMDFISLTVVLLHCFKIRSMQGSLGLMFVRQGLISFVVVLLVNVTAAIVYFGRKSQYNGVGLPFMLVLSNLVACRLILGLSRRASPTDTKIIRQHSQIVRDALDYSPDRNAKRKIDVWLMMI
ncbi:hypothetical protein HGRIS_005131 [Hohenbuehelia grisea]